MKANRFFVAALAMASLIYTTGFIYAQDHYAVVVGVEAYNPSSFEDLDYAEDDAQGLGRAFSALGYNTTIMTSANARTPAHKPYSPKNIIKVITAVSDSCIKGDTLVISLSGHGVQFIDEEPLPSGVHETYFCPESADTGDKSTLLPISRIVEIIDQSEATRKLLLIDACREQMTREGEANSRSARKIKLDAVHENRKSIPGGMAVLFSCKSSQLSWEHDRLGHSVFSHFVIQYLEGNADQQFYSEGKYTLDGLAYFVRKNTNQYVFDNNISADGQRPVLHTDSEEWPLASVNVLVDYRSSSEEKLMQHVEMGLAKAQHELGLRYRHGIGREQDFVKAMEYFVAAAEQANAQSFFEIGFLYDYGLGHTRNFEEALDWYEMAVESGDERAFSYIGFLYRHGQGVKQDDELAAEWFEKGVAVGDPISMTFLAEIIYEQDSSDDARKRMYALVEDAANSEVEEWPEDLLTLETSHEKDRLTSIAKSYFWMGWFHESGYVVEQSNRWAQRWYTKGAEQGDNWSLESLGDLYLSWDPIKDVEKAIEFYELAANQNNTGAMRTLAEIYMYGYLDKEIDLEQAFYYYSAAADLGDSDAQHETGNCFFRGLGVAQNYRQAVEYFQRAAEQGNSASMNYLARCYDEGDGVGLDDAEAIRWYKRAADLGHVQAQYNLGMMHFNGEGTKSDLQEAMVWLLKAATHDSPNANDMLGDIYGNEENEKLHSYEKALEYYRKGAELGFAESMNMIGLYHDEGYGIEINDVQAIEWYRMAADRGESVAQYNLGLMYQNGEGVEVDLDQARIWLKLAADSGFEQAAEALEGLGK